MGDKTSLSIPSNRNREFYQWCNFLGMNTEDAISFSTTVMKVLGEVFGKDLTDRQIADDTETAVRMMIEGRMRQGFTADAELHRALDSGDYDTMVKAMQEALNIRAKATTERHLASIGMAVYIITAVRPMDGDEFARTLIEVGHKIVEWKFDRVARNAESTLENFREWQKQNRETESRSTIRKIGVHKSLI